jgi:hypothetical protein
LKRPLADNRVGLGIPAASSAAMAPGRTSYVFKSLNEARVVLVEGSVMNESKNTRQLSMAQCNEVRPLKLRRIARVGSGGERSRCDMGPTDSLWRRSLLLSM